MGSLAGGRSRQSKEVVIPTPHPDPTPQGGREIVRWAIPIGGGAITSVLIVVATPHVAWVLRLVLAIVAFLYFAGQSAAYLWSSSDQGE